MRNEVNALLLLCLTASGLVLVQSVKGQYQGSVTEMTINPDGTVMPTTAPIQRSGNSYTLTGNWLGMIIVERSNVRIDGRGYTVSGVQVSNTKNVTLENFNVVSGLQFGEEFNGLVAGIFLSGTSETTVANNTVTDVQSFYAIFVEYERVAGIIVEGGRSNVIKGNKLVNDWQGMYFSGSNFNKIVGNTIQSNASDLTGYSEPGGIEFENSGNNTIYHNNLEVNAGGNAFDSYFGSLNTWDDGYPWGGNYWSDYKTKYPHAAEIGSTGIGDSAYFIDGPDNNSTFLNNTDRFPLMGPFTDAFAVKQTTPPTISIISPKNQSNVAVDVNLAFSTEALSPAKTISWIAYGLDGQPNVTLTSTPAFVNITLTHLTAGLHNITVYADDNYGNNATPQTVNFNVINPTKPSQTLLVVSISVGVLFAVVFGVLLTAKKRKCKKRS